ncbi:MAG: Asp-tRNA(Asn)/Glu-tRNA(Gln) amidotransferase subunit GatB [Oscillospiraceae bacterium]|nr:Asp-tRNA(Asn)/Glu-tRNA(Gln) amidotransferase subunit GatB [Oscillospiraceae bacterium]
MEYELVIGLEIHVELSTKTKIYCRCSTTFGGRANTNVCPVCLALPGALPVLNREVVNFGIKSGLALNCSINDYCHMDRKNYFYPDITKNYQITQFPLPLCKDGFIDMDVDGEKKRIRIERVHIEEDTGKALHTNDKTLMDFNRCGVPLIEIVTEPDLRSKKEAILFLERIKSILIAIGVSECKMEEGQLRCDLNTSVRKKGEEKLGVRCELKNMSSFKAIEKAIDFEFERQVKAIENGEKLIQETRRWDEKNLVSISMREKQSANDYRYYPEGDLGGLKVSDEWVESIRKTIPELPHERIERFVRDYKIPEYDAEVLNLSKTMADFFEETAKISKDPKSSSNWLMGDISRLLNEEAIKIDEIKFSPSSLAELIVLINEGVISNAIGKTVLEEMFRTGNEPKKIVEEKGLRQNSDEEEIKKIAIKILKENNKIVLDYKAGKVKIIGFAVGLVMKETKGKANPQIVNKIVINLLNSGNYYI